MPLFGPSNVRDSVGTVVGFVTNPVNLVSGGTATAISAASGGLGVVDGRAQLLGTTDSLKRSSLDYYAALRSAAAQRRAALVAEGKAGLVTTPTGGPKLPADIPPTAGAGAVP